MKKLYREADNKLKFTIKKLSDGLPYDHSTMTNAVYTILDSKYGVEVISVSYVDGKIVKDDTKTNVLRVTLDDSIMNMPPDKYWHKLVIFNAAGDKSPPAVNEIIEIE